MVSQRAILTPPTPFLVVMLSEAQRSRRTCFLHFNRRGGKPRTSISHRQFSALLSEIEQGFPESNAQSTTSRGAAGKRLGDSPATPTTVWHKKCILCL
jgi:hypothetical protein